MKKQMYNSPTLDIVPFGQTDVVRTSDSLASKDVWSDDIGTWD